MITWSPQEWFVHMIPKVIIKVPLLYKIIFESPETFCERALYKIMISSCVNANQDW